MRKIFLDTNVVVDLLDKREPFYEAAVTIFSLAYHKKLLLYVSPVTYATAAFLLRKHGKEQVKLLLRNLRQLSRVTLIDERVVDDTLASLFSDHEDGLQYYSAQTKNVDIILTRNPKDFKYSSIPVLTPDEFLAQI
jgi:predicted nucleic acid-binding protein